MTKNEDVIIGKLEESAPTAPPPQAQPKEPVEPDLSNVVFYMSIGIGWHLTPDEFNRYIGALDNYSYLMSL